MLGRKLKFHESKEEGRSMIKEIKESLVLISLKTFENWRLKGCSSNQISFQKQMFKPFPIKMNKTR